MPLDQINASNFSKLEVAWRFSTSNLGPRPEFNLQGTPLMITGTLYATGGGGNRRAIVAIDAKTGELLWKHGIDEGERADAAPRKLSGRGLAYWTDGRGDERIIYVTIGYRLVSLNARTGQPIPSFGKDGIVDLKVGVMTHASGKPEQIDLEKGEIGLHCDADDRRRHRDRRLGVLGRAQLSEQVEYARPGARLRRPQRQAAVEVRSVPEARRARLRHVGERLARVTSATWACGRRSPPTRKPAWSICPSSSRRRTSTAAIGPATNLFGETLVAVDLKTGLRKWHFQFTHHPIWDLDIPSAPILARHRRRRQADQGGGGADQAKHPLRVRSHHRRAGVADRREAGAAEHRAGREDVADAAVPDQAAGVRAQLSREGRHHRLHAGAARRRR